jgi:sugar lactone lactonase YvrE
METLVPEVLLRDRPGFIFPEGPRWRGGKLWLSDIMGGQILTLDLHGRVEQVASVPGSPSGLGFLPDDTLLAASMRDRTLLQFDGGRVTHATDLRAVTRGLLNDMVVDGAGRAYVGDIGFDLLAGAPPAPGAVLLVTPPGEAASPDATARVVADDLSMPNGMVISPDGRSLVVAESFGHRLTRFAIGEDGSLHGRATFAELGDRTPDGICLDAAGAVWVACIDTGEFLRVFEGGAITHRIAAPGQRALACMLGGDDRRTLFLLTAAGTMEDARHGTTSGVVQTVRVETPGAGLP